MQQLAEDLERKVSGRLDRLIGNALEFDIEQVDDPVYVRRFLATRRNLWRDFSGGASIVGVDGYTIAAYPSAPESKGVYLGDQDYVREVLAARMHHISTPAIDPITKQVAFRISVPVLDPGGQYW